MQAGSREFEQLQTQFEQTIKKLDIYIPGGVRLDREAKTSDGQRRGFYEDQATNNLFVAYMAGYAFSEALTLA